MKTNVSLDKTNIKELKELLRTAKSQTQQLQETLQQIDEFKLVTKPQFLCKIFIGRLLLHILPA